MERQLYNGANPYPRFGETWAEAIRVQFRVIAALVRRETRAHFGESRLGYLWAIIEPLAHLLVLGGLFIYILRRQAPVGGSLWLFFMTGLIPYFLYYKIASYLCGAVIENRPLLNLPPVKPLDVVVSRTIIDAAANLLVAILLFSALALGGVAAAVPADPIRVAAALCAIVGFGFGVGMINAVITSFVRSWAFIFGLVFGPIYLLSGIFFMVDEVPSPLRDYLLYNPIVHLIIWFRGGFYPGFSSAYFSRSYATWCAILVVVLGLGLFRVTRRKLLEPV
jgi:capsular polysaccharide transport system permease protein